MTFNNIILEAISKGFDFSQFEDYDDISIVKGELDEFLGTNHFYPEEESKEESIPLKTYFQILKGNEK